MKIFSLDRLWELRSENKTKVSRVAELTVANYWKYMEYVINLKILQLWKLQKIGCLRWKDV